jgi:hypothetical protein
VKPERHVGPSIAIASRGGSTAHCREAIQLGFGAHLASTLQIGPGLAGVPEPPARLAAAVKVSDRIRIIDLSCDEGKIRSGGIAHSIKVPEPCR